MDERQNISLPQPGKWLRLNYLVVALCLLVLCLGGFYLKGFAQYLVVGTMAIAILISLIFIQSLSSRVHGIRVEKKAISLVQSVLPNGWRVVSGVPTGDGDLDILVVSFAGERFAIEVKSHRKVEVRGWFTKKLVKTDKGKFSRDPVEQAVRNGIAVGAKPILWFPAAEKKGIKKINDLVVVFGGKRQICKALGIKNFLGIF